MAEGAVEKRTTKPATSTLPTGGDRGEIGELPKGMLVPVAALAADQ
jgi:hypothetical protein